MVCRLLVDVSGEALWLKQVHVSRKMNWTELVKHQRLKLWTPMNKQVAEAKINKTITKLPSSKLVAEPIRLYIIHYLQNYISKSQGL